MDIVLQVKSVFTSVFGQILGGLDASDQMVLMAIGLGLLILAVAVLIWQRRNGAERNAPTRTTLAQSLPRAVPGERHVVTRQKGDAFLRRLDQMG